MKSEGFCIEVKLNKIESDKSDLNGRGYYICTIKPSEKRVQVVKENRAKDYLLAYDLDRQDYMLLDEFVDSERPIAEKVVEELVFENIF